MSIPYTFIARLVGVFIQTFFLNLRRKKIGKQLSWRDQMILVWAGLRGGIAFALATSWGLPDEEQE